MALQDQVVPISLSQGVDTKTDPKQVLPGKLLTLENGYFQTPKRISKMPGFSGFGLSVVSTGAADTIQSGNGVFAYNDQLVMYSPTNTTETTSPIGRVLYSYVRETDSWSLVDYYHSAKITTSPVWLTYLNSTDSDQKYQDVAYDATSGLQCVTWYTNAFLYYSIIEKSTGRNIFTNSITGGIAYSKALFFSNKFVIIHSDTSGNLKYYTVAPATPAQISGPTTLATNVNTAAPTFDATVISTKLFLTYNYTTTGISTLYLDSSFVKSSETHDTTHAATLAITLCGDGSNNVNIAYSNGTNAYCLIYDFTMTPVLAVTTLAAIANVNQIGIVWGGASNNYIHAYYCAESVHSTDNKINYATFNSGGVVQATLVLQRSVSLASKPFAYNGHVFFTGLYGGPTTGQPTLFLFMTPIVSSGYNPTVIGKFAPAMANDYTRVSSMAEVVQISTGVYQVGFAQTAGTSDIAPISTSWIATYDLTVTPQSAQIANTLHLTGGQLWMYDGAGVYEHGFHIYPELGTPTPSGAAGPFAANTSYQYIAVYEWVDAQGQTHRSAPSLAVSVTAGGSGAASMAVDVSYLRVTNKCPRSFRNLYNQAKICLYRTTGNGTIFYFCASGFNQTTADTATFTDTATDATILGNIQLYTTGGQVENASAPPCLAVATYKNRLIVVPSDNPYSWWFSQEVIPASASTSATPVELSEFLIQSIDQKGGPITGVISMDDKLVLMKKDLPYYVVGNGPSANGGNNDYSPPQQITSPVGSTSAASMVLGPMGVIFQAANNAGIWLLDRSLGVNYIGDEVEAYNSQTVTSAIAYPTYNQMRFTMSGGVCLAYDYYMKQWTVRTNVAAVQACLFQGLFTYVRSTGKVLQESTSVFTDDGTFVSLKMIFSWLQTAGIQGFQRLRQLEILGEYKSAHNLLVQIAYDFSTSYGQSQTINVTGSLVPLQYQLSFNQQKCEALQIYIQDQNSGVAGESLNISALSLTAAVKKGLQKLPPTQTY